MSSDFRICIITTNKGAYSETFIRNHIRELPFTKSVLYGGLSAISDWKTDRSLVSPYLIKLVSKITTQQTQHLQTKYLLSFLKKKKIHAVLAEFGPVGERVVDACQQARIPLVVHFHGDDAHRTDMIHKYDGYQKLINYAQAVVCVSQPMKEQLRELGFQDQQLHLIPYGIDIQFFGNGSPVKSEPVFLAVGRFVNKKAPHLTILAFQKVVKVVPKAKLVMVGKGPLLGVCQSLAKALQIDHAIHFKGVCDSAEVAQLMKTSRAFVMHSLTPDTGEKEGTPLSILEACATGLPVVSTFHAGIPEAVIHKESGFLVNEYDIEGMADYIIKLAQDSVLAQSMGEAGRRHINIHYNLSDQISKLATVLSQTITDT
ncbi:MAG: glycosyltransferase [Cyclobacteriaceae bacterium]